MASKEPDDDDEWGENAAETPTRPKALVLHPWCWELRLIYVCFVRTGRNFCLMASSPYGCFDWILQCKILTPSYDAWNALEVHTASEIHTPLGIRENARSWLFDWSKPTDGATKSGQTPRTHCGVMASKKCELKDRITPHVTNFSRFRLGKEKQEWKRKYKSDGGTMVVCM